MNTIKKFKHIIIISGVQIFLYCYINPTMNLADDFEYSRIAYEITQGNIDIEHIHSARIALTLPTAFFYKIFGVNDYSTTLVIFLCSLLLVIALYYFGNLIEPYIGTIASALLVISPLFVETSLTLYPEIVFLCFVFIGCALVFCRNQLLPDRPLFLSFLTASAFWLAMLAKETVILFIPLVLVFLIADIFKKQNFKYWIFTISFVSFLTIVYLFYCYKITGDWLSRIHAVQNHPVTMWSDKSVIGIKRMLIKPVVFISNNFGIYLLLFFIAIYFFVRKKMWHTQYNNWFLYLFIVGTMLWVYPVSFSPYYPIPLFKRYWILILIPLLIFSAKQLKEMLISNREDYKHIVFPVLIIMFLYSVYKYINPEEYAHLFIFIPLFLIIVFNFKRFFSQLLKVSILLLVFLIPLFTYVTDNKSLLSAERDAMKQLKKEKNVILLTDWHFAQRYKYYFQFKDQVNFLCYDWESSDEIDTSKYYEYFVLVKYDRIKYFHNQGLLDNDRILRYDQIPWDRKFQRNRGRIPYLIVYRIDSLDELKEWI